MNNRIKSILSKIKNWLNWLQTPLGSGIISGIVTGLVVGVFLIYIAGWIQETSIPSIILINYTTKGSSTNIPNSQSNLNIDVSLLISNPSSKSIIVEDVIIIVEVNGSWQSRESGGVFYETIVRNGEQIISSTRGNNFGKIPQGNHRVRVTVNYYDGKSTESLYGSFDNLLIDEFGIPSQWGEFKKIKLTPNPE